jgi:hypothetical protein
MAGEETTPSDEKTCFVIMGFGEKPDFQTGRVLDLNKLYKNIIKPAVERVTEEMDVTATQIGTGPEADFRPSITPRPYPRIGRFPSACRRTASLGLGQSHVRCHVQSNRDFMGVCQLLALH